MELKGGWTRRRLAAETEFMKGWAFRSSMVVKGRELVVDARWQGNDGRKIWRMSDDSR